jgi:uncharacterized protein (TIRG00374 family)
VRVQDLRRSSHVIAARPATGTFLTVSAERSRPHGVGDRLEEAIVHRVELDRELQDQLTREPEETEVSKPRLRKTAFWLTITGISLYLVFPSVLDVLGSWKRLNEFGLGWLALMLLLQGASTACLWEVQHLALRAKGMFAVATSQLAGNAMSKVAPGGGAVGAALQYKMLVASGYQRTAVAGALTATNLLVVGTVLGLPLMAIPSIARGAVARGLLEATIIGVIVFLVLFGLGALCLRRDDALRWIGRVVQGARNRVRRGSPPLDELPDRLLRERDRILATLGPRWQRALAATLGRWAFDYATLLAALAAVGSRPAPSLVLIAFCAAQVLAQIPITPGGLGFVEAGLTGLLSLAGVPAGAAVLATFAYRLFSYWLVLPVGVVAWGLHRRRTQAEPA